MPAQYFHPLYRFELNLVFDRAIFEVVVREQHIPGGDGLTIMKASIRAQVKDNPAVIRRVLRRLGNQSVGHLGFVRRRAVGPAADHQRFVKGEKSQVVKAKGRDL